MRLSHLERDVAYTLPTCDILKGLYYNFSAIHAIWEQTLK